MSDAHIPLDLIISVLLDQGPNEPLDYKYPSKYTHPLVVGSRVLVPIRKQWLKGTVIAFKKPSFSSPFSLKEIKEVLSQKSLLSPALFELANWISLYYCSPLRKVLHLFLPSPVRKEISPKKQCFVKKNISTNQCALLCASLRKTHPKQAHILEILLKAKKEKGMFLRDLLKISNTSLSPVKTLVRKKALTLTHIEIDRNPLENFEFFPTKPKILNAQQKKAFKNISSSLEKNIFQTHLIHGITGSGKTEIYLQAIDKSLSQKKSIIFLAPEITLTTQMIERFRSRFNKKLGIFHSRLSEGKRFDIWHAINRGEIMIIMGPRSAIFLPAQNLGLIIVDEEHESSYKQSDESPCYHARDVAIMRGKKEQATVILGSATPSIESYINGKKGKYLLEILKSRAEKTDLPKVQLVDMKKEWHRTHHFTLFSQPLLEALQNRYEKGEQALLFLNKRGYHSFLLCISCNHSIECPNCSLSLTFHKQNNYLACHLCGLTQTPIPKICPKCKKPATLHFRGVGTELVEKSLHAILPHLRTLRMDADTTRLKGSHEKLLKSFRSGKADVLIGTQMIAKGLHFPAVTFVGVLNSDSALHLPDFRASETLFQLLTQVAGRSGRGELPGEVIIQTCLSKNPLFHLATQGNYTAFFEEELKIRQLFKYPPFSHLAKITLSGTDEKKVQDYLHHLRSVLLHILPSSYFLFPIVPSGYLKIKNRFRYKLLLKGKSGLILSKAIKQALEKAPCPRQLHLLIDIDPSSTFY